MKDQNAFVLHRKPPLTLCGDPICSGTKVEISGSDLMVTLFKARDVIWPRLLREEFSWIQKSHYSSGGNSLQNNRLDEHLEAGEEKIDDRNEKEWASRKNCKNSEVEGYEVGLQN